MKTRYLSQTEFNDNFGNEMADANSIYKGMIANGTKEYSLLTFDFTYISDAKDKLDSLAVFLSNNYGFKNYPIKKQKGYWELKGDATAFPLDSSNLMYWAIDLYYKGYEFDCKLTGYGALADPNNQNFPKLDSNLYDHYFDIAMEAYNKRNLGMAIIHFSTAIRIDPKNPDAWYSRGLIKDELRTQKAARCDYDKALELAPHFVDALISRATNKDESGEFDEALKDYDEAILLDPKNTMAYFNRGNTKFNKGNKKEACMDWTKAKSLGAEYAQKRIDEVCK
ncbi:tetratricopeptide repeat protein [Pinibacter soli]|uniref:Tetratricopeptide repeat protein n=1 Tax=Pinibacter soli TaxID=3044211 RepID=A0ABT6RF57_9BACT|nr:tetratricopeptide repeat protein [Pinibacter soli]MDI3321204.1 tetratricopeptide repeat protein [Pinibacter soli]